MFSVCRLGNIICFLVSLCLGPWCQFIQRVSNLFRLFCSLVVLQNHVRISISQVHLLPDVDMIYVLDHGRIVKRGTFAEIESTGFSFALLRQHAGDAPAAVGMPLLLNLGIHHHFENSYIFSFGQYLYSFCWSLFRNYSITFFSRKNLPRVTEVNHSIAATADIGGSAAAGGASVMVLTVNPLATATVSASPAVVADSGTTSGTGTVAATDTTPDHAIASKPDDNSAAPVSVSAASAVSVTASASAAAISAAATVTAGKKLVQDEDRAKGYVESGVYFEYFRRLGGLVFVFFMMFFMAGGQVAMIAMDVWLSHWAVDAYGREYAFCGWRKIYRCFANDGLYFEFFFVSFLLCLVHGRFFTIALQPCFRLSAI
jgi:hypothetical protein